MEYLKIAQDLEMYGVSYFEIKVQFFISSLVKLECEIICEIIIDVWTMDEITRNGRPL